MNARLQRLAALGWGVLLLGVAAGWMRNGVTLGTWLGVLGLLSLPIVLALQMAAMVFVNARAQRTWVSPWVVLQAWAGELRAAVRVFAWQQPFRGAAHADTVSAGETARGSRAVLLVHGFSCTRGLWLPWLRRLHQTRRCCIAVTLEPAWGSIDAYTGAIEDAVVALEAATGMAPVVVAHSMGGLAVRAWWADQPADRLHHLITLGTPHHGTWLAAVGHVTNVRQMRRGSAWLKALDQRERQGAAQRRARTTCFWSDCDNIVFPARTATLEGAENRLLRGAGHVAMIWRAEPWQALERSLCDPQQNTEHP